MDKAHHPTKRERILQICDEENFAFISRKEIETINNRLEKELGSEGRTSPSYIANVLVEAGKDVHYKDILVKTKPPVKYEKELEGLLQFKDLKEAEETIQKMNELQKKIEQSGDEAGLEYLRQLAERGYRRCLMIAKNEKVEMHKREEKKEIAFWFKLWLDNPGIFAIWIELRKKSPEYKEKFAKHTD
jgi:hypothetical protein